MGEGPAVKRACRIVGVSQNGYYSWLTRPPSQRAIRHAWLTDQIIEIHAASRGTYGTRRDHGELAIGRGIKAGHGAVEMLVSRASIHGLPGPRRRKKVHASSPPPTLLTKTLHDPHPTGSGSPT